ncbi:peptide-N4-(N-acetyl-beta-glucosaminyl)asparagine amidase A [Dioscorea cayenensis subsp. rotundata]|uniref:Peptide-N4-(N-acetyl-beta- glucosaminyl)asparagine amidase A n=1 Tax=Dioscorea cayennensis subsp. rotundata TaxID=55577 RepID=A0AB40BCM6_DIOCR|nr:peptide-N4-(N-acetyl-beta-glucosaminyl)asparagine amidase A [Dioscorea cayenensis subsp. rotundata]
MPAMASSPPLLLLLLLFFVSVSTAHLHRSIHRVFENSMIEPSTIPPSTFFEVTKPISIPDSTPCSTLLLQHDFAFTYGKPPVTAPYSFPSHCPQNPPSKIVLEWTATSRGRQFDRIFGVWLSGVELLRSCTAEPRLNGIIWTVRKDVTRYSSIFARSSTLAVYLGNLVDSTYTGVYHVNISLHFYYDGSDHSSATPGFNSPADLILPISRSLPLNDGLWLPIQNSTDAQSKQVRIPTNTYRAVLEVFVSFHSNDEFWYTNPPNDYITENNITGMPGNGAFREVVVFLDDSVIGAVWPFPVIYTGGINPLLWRPITGIGSFDLPSYDIEVTPFLGKILDGKLHEFGFRVTDALDVWFVDANLHLWLDGKNDHVHGEVVEYKAPALEQSSVYKFKGLDGSFRRNARRELSATGWVNSSYGKISTHFFQKLEYENLMVFDGNGSVQVINQTTGSHFGTYVRHPSSGLYSEQVFQAFPLYVYTATTDQVNDSYSLLANLSRGFNEKKLLGERDGLVFSSLWNLQDSQGEMRVKGNLVTSGVGGSKQVYRYESTGGCYFRNVSSYNYTLLNDESGASCAASSLFGSENLFTKFLPYPTRRASLSLELGDAEKGD